MESRAYSLLTVKAVDDEQRVITGVATSPSPDRVGDVVEPMGVKFKNPLPLLHQHDHQRPVGTVRFDKPTKDGITFTARLPKIAEPGPLKDRVDTAWGEVKAGLIRAVSIGFRALDDGYELMKSGGIRFTATEVLELSLVTVPANQDAKISAIKSIDTRQRAASGRLLRSTNPGVSGTSTKPRDKGDSGMDIKKRLAELEAQRATVAKAMQDIMAKADGEGRDMDAEESEQYDDLAVEAKGLADKIDRMQSLQVALGTATTVKGATARAGSENRAGTRAQVTQKELPKGTAFTRYAIALARSKGNLMQAGEIAKQWHDTPEVETVIKAAVAAGTTTDANWAGPLVEYNTMTGEFIELLRPATIIGRIPNLRNVPFNISMPRQTSGATVGWVGEGKAKPLSAGAFDTVTLRWAKAAGIVVLTSELVRFSSPSAEAVVRQDLIDAMAAFLDRQFVDPNVAEVSNISPASITYGVTPVVPTGTTAAALRTDFRTMANAFLTANLSMAGAVLIMTEQLALAIQLLTNALGQPEFPTMTPDANGNRRLMGLPVITSESAQATEDPTSPQQYEGGGLIILAKASEIMLADDGQVMLDVSAEASVQMDSAPDEPTDASTVLVSLWQRNMIGLKAERWINWKKRRSAAVQFITGANYGA